MNITETIGRRVSVRTFNADRPLTKSDIQILTTAIKEASSPFGGRYDIKLRQFDLKGPQRPSTYGTITGASWYLLMGAGDDEVSALSAGYAMEQVVLRATDAGLGTCWMAATFKGTDFGRAAEMPADMPLRVISPVGYPAEKRRMLESLTRATLGSSRRKPMDELFSEGSFGRPVSADSPFYKPLEMMRLAPSAKNTQPWRALVQGSEVWFYYEKKTEISLLDLGIGLSHFDLTLGSLGHAGTWTTLLSGTASEAPSHPGYIPAAKFTLATK